MQHLCLICWLGNRVDLNQGLYLRACSRDEMMDEATPNAEKIRASRGNYETEVSCTGEVGLRECLRRCVKNPGHLNFIPKDNFNIEHLPPRYRDNLLVDYAGATSDLTCRLSVSRISGDRPATWPGSDQPFPFSKFKGNNCTITGTGWVSQVLRHTERILRPEGGDLFTSCRCYECISVTRKPKWPCGEIIINTANHLVYNDEEAGLTKCQFFYDSHETDIKEVHTFDGFEVLMSEVDGDLCKIIFYTHDMDLVNRFYEMWRRWDDLRLKVIEKYASNMSPGLADSAASCDTNVSHDLCMVVSHPHGCAKVISLGTWTGRHVKQKYDVTENVTYRYNTPTCPGSSGAPVLTLCKDNRTAGFYDFPPHSEGRPGNDNNSGEGVEKLSSGNDNI